MRRISIALTIFMTLSTHAQSVQRNLRAANEQKGTEAEIVKEIEVEIDRLVAEDSFSGAVLVAKDGKPILKKAYGLANKSKNSPNSVDTKFNLGSINKSFTSVAIAQLAQQGKLSFTDTINKHLPDYPNKTVAGKVTIHQLLTHTSGMGSYFNQEFMARKASLKTLADIVPLFVDKPLAFDPGEDVRYSNAGYVVLGLIIERLSGMSYFDYVREHIFKPAGMTNTDSFEREQKVLNLATGYTRMGPNGMSGLRRDNTTTLPGKGSSAGGGYSTVEDMLKFVDALLTHKLLNAKYTEIIFTANRPAGSSEAITGGYGFTFNQVNETRIVGNGGGAPGINAIFRIYLDKRYTVVVLSNYDPPSAENVAGKIKEILLAA